jgi:hypothetical protein
VLAHEGVGFIVTHDGGRVLDVERMMDLRARVRRLFGTELGDALVPVDARGTTCSSAGWSRRRALARADPRA